MQVLLKAEVDKLGRSGEIVEVADGYARNYLMPQRLATLATAEALRQAEHQRVVEEKAEQKRQEELRSLAERLSRASITITAQANEEGVLFGSVSSEDLVAALAEEEPELEIDPRAVQLEKPFKETGIYAVPVALEPELTATLKVWIVSE